MIPAPRANVSSPLCKKPNPSSLASSSSSSSSSSSRAVDIYVDGTETSAEVKQAIFEATGIPPHAQEIEVNGKRLCDEVVLKDQCIKKVSCACSLKEVADDIFVDTGKLSLDVDAFDTGLSVKEKIEEITQIPSQLQRLSHNDKQLLDSEPLKSHSLNDGNEIDMIVRLDNAYSEVPSTHKGKAKRSKRVEKGKACLNSCTSKKVKDSTELPWDDIKCIEDPTLSKPKMPKPLMSLYSLRGSSTNCDASIHKVIGTSQLQGDSCAVCKCDLQTGGEDVVVETPCRHRFHKDCLTPWLLIGNKTCPQCRFSLSSDGRAAEKRASLDVDKKECKTCDRRVRRKVLDDTFGGIL
eukprot:jgi/Bigna1/54167/estExt_Genewise1Plus.C_290082